ncbi:MAG: hypothetical protein AAB551_04300 [Patescibacteria group bacterium]
MPLCRITQQPFEISEREMEFCKRMNVPLPTVSPNERFRQLMAFRNEWKLYRRKCDATKEDIISAYSPDSPFVVYKNSVWWGDTWDAMEHGRDFDFTRPFFEQFAELQKVVPREGTTIFNCENCDYNSHWRNSKNCYLNSLGHLCEDVYYSYWMVQDKDVFDSMYTGESTLCYSCSDTNRCYNCVMLFESNDCRDCFFSYQLQGCDNCLFSTNLVHKTYHIFNEPVSKEEFEAYKAKIFDGSWKTWQQAYQDFLKIRESAISPSVYMMKCENSTGNHVYNSKNCSNCFDTFDAEDCENSISAANSKDVHSSYSAGWTQCELTYYSLVSRSATNIAFCNYTWSSSDLRYCDSTVNSHDLFGCIGMRQKRFCILNKQYTEEEYRVLVPKIIEHMKKTGEWGEFFPMALSPYAYNETAAHEFFTLSPEEALERGFRWKEESTASASHAPRATMKVLPDSLSQVSDDICKEILGCKNCGKSYRVIPQELKFYRLMNLPLPRNCSMCRHQERIHLRNPLRLWQRICEKCGTMMESSFSPERPVKVYCQECYRKEVY